MVISRAYRVVSAVNLPLMIAILVVGVSECKGLRPSEHGLAYQSNSTEAVKARSPEATTFFRGKPTEAASVPSGPLMPAKNASDDESWLNNVSGGRRKDHVRKGLVVATVVCGAVGVAFLAVAGLIFLVQYRRRRREREASGRAAPK